MKTPGISLEEAVEKLALSKIRQSTLTQAKPSNNEAITDTRLLTKRNFSTTPNTSIDATLKKYQRLSLADQLKTLTVAGFHQILHKPLATHPPSLTDFDSMQKEVRRKYPQAFAERDTLDQSFIKLIHSLPPYDPTIQQGPIIEDINDACLMLTSTQQPMKETSLPFGRRSTEDSIAATKLLTKHAQPQCIVFEDGSGNGQHLIELTHALLKGSINVSSIGSDITPLQMNIGNLLSASIGLGNTAQFFAAHALYRNSPRQMTRLDHQHITLALRLLPVLTENRIEKYLSKVSSEMNSDDLFCVSIALPDGQLYEENRRDQTRIKQYQIKRIQTSFGGETFVHRPDFGNTSDGLLLSAFNAQLTQQDVPIEAKDLQEVVLNTYMTVDTFEKLAKKHNLKFAESPVIVPCEDNLRAVVLLKKT